MSNPIVSLCMPTNGIVEWVFPVLDSIYEQGCNNKDFEIVITDNGQNDVFKEKIKKYNEKHLNLNYYETNALPFINEIESYKRANGKLIKFVNHRTLLIKGALQRLIKLAKDNCDTKPIMYFANGVLEKDRKIYEYGTFDQFVRNLSYWSSWSTGMTIWKDDFEELINKNIKDFNELFPHTNVLFAERQRGKYIIDNSLIFEEIPQGKKPKGDYDIFYAFGVEYPSIILNLYRQKSISACTFKTIINDNLFFIAHLYINYFIKKEYCSYELGGLDDMFGVFYSKRCLYKEIFLIFLRKIIPKPFFIKNRKKDV